MPTLADLFSAAGRSGSTTAGFGNESTANFTVGSPDGFSGLTLSGNHTNTYAYYYGPETFTLTVHRAGQGSSASGIIQNATHYSWTIDSWSGSAGEIPLLGTKSQNTIPLQIRGYGIVVLTAAFIVSSLGISSSQTLTLSIE